MRHLVNAYEVEAGTVKFAGNTVYDPYLSASEVVFHEEALYQVYLPLPPEDPLAVHCFCVCSGSALMGDLGVSRSMERDLLSVLLIYARIFLRVSYSLCIVS